MKSKAQVQKELDRNQKIHELYKSGLNKGQIAEELYLSYPTVLNSLKWEYTDTLNDIKKENAYELEDDDIVFYVNRKDQYDEVYKERIAIPLEDVGEMCYDYTYGWLSGKKVQIKHELKPRSWNLLRSRLNINKDSNALPDVVLDYVKEKYGEEEVEARIIDVSHRAAKDKYRGRFIKQYDKALIREDDKSRKAFANNENFLKYLNTFLEDYVPEPVVLEPLKKDNKTECTYVITDLHIGKQGTDEIKRRLEKIASDASNSSFSKINILCLWDLVETIAPEGMHSGQLESMDWIYWFDLLMQSADLIEQLILAIRNAGKQVTFTGITWNHDRIAKGHDQDHQRTAWLVIYELISRCLTGQPGIDIVYLRDKWNNLVLGNIGYIIHHWDDRATSKQTSNIIMERWLVAQYTIVLMGDKHHLEMKDESSNITRILAPALAWVGEYDTRIGVSSPAWYLQIFEGWDDLPQINTIRMK